MSQPVGTHDAAVEIDGRTYRLAIGELRRLEAAAGSGVFALFERLGDRTCTIDDVCHVHRLGLLGGGHARDEVERILREEVERDLIGARLVAFSVLGAALMLPEGEPAPGNADAPTGGPEATTASPSDASTGGAP